MNNVASSGETYHSFLFRISHGIAALQALERSWKAPTPLILKNHRAIITKVS